jgi:hypothetical protein
MQAYYHPTEQQNWHRSTQGLLTATSQTKLVWPLPLCTSAHSPVPTQTSSTHRNVPTCTSCEWSIPSHISCHCPVHPTPIIIIGTYSPALVLGTSCVWTAPSHIYQSCLGTYQQLAPGLMIALYQPAPVNKRPEACGHHATYGDRRRHVLLKGETCLT